MSLEATPPRALRGYAPLVAVLAVLAAFTALVPTTGRELLRADTTTRVGTPADGGVSGPDVVVDPVTGAPTSGPRTAAVAGGPSAATTGCPDRALQIPGDPYSPPCVAFAGDNGGATHKGVTGDTIKVAWRLTNDAAAAGAVQSAVGSGVDITDTREDLVRTIEGITDYINDHFQLYGRKIDVEVFDGRGSGADELVGAGQDAANADAVTVASQLGAFLEASAGTAPYTDALARRGVVSIGVDYLSEEWYSERHPYVWTNISCTQAIRQVAEYANKRLFGGTADHAGDGLVGKPRKIGLISPENSYYQDCVKTFEADLRAEGNAVSTKLTYALDINTVSQDTSAIVARLAADGITTVICFTDPVSPLFYTAKATQQKYFPEWIVAGTAATDSDTAGQLYDEAQWANAFGLRTRTQPVPRPETFAYAAFKAARPDLEPAGLALYGIYDRLYMMALAIQGAGPNLTPETFGAGFQAYSGGRGTSGTWKGRPGVHSLQIDAEEVYWDPAATSTFNGGDGSYIRVSPRYELGQWPRGKPAVP